MKKFLEEIKRAKKLELFLLIAAGAMLLLVIFREAETGPALRSETEKRLISALSSIEGTGNTDALITESNGKTRVLVISEGAEDLNVQLRILRAVRIMFNLELSDIEVIPHEQ